MADRFEFADDDVGPILAAVDARLKQIDPDQDEARLLKRCRNNLLLDCRSISENITPDASIAFLSSIQSAFEIGTLCSSAILANASRRDSSAKGGSRGSKTRNQRADERWRNQATVKAQQIRAMRPDLSQRGLVTEIIFQLGDDLISYESMLNHVRILEKSGRLPKRRKM